MIDMRLETERLILAPWEDTDWAAFRPIATDVEVMRYITGGVAWSDERIRTFVKRQVELYRTRGFCRWKLMLKPAKESDRVLWSGVLARRTGPGDRVVAGAPVLGARAGNRSRQDGVARRLRARAIGSNHFGRHAGKQSVDADYGKTRPGIRMRFRERRCATGTVCDQSREVLSPEKRGPGRIGY